MIWARRVAAVPEEGGAVWGRTREGLGVGRLWEDSQKVAKCGWCLRSSGRSQAGKDSFRGYSTGGLSVCLSGKMLFNPLSVLPDKKSVNQGVNSAFL